ncbi:MAG: MraY family glycosyltransferase [Candidatus Portnoybacteria bacterium]|nr:MraY family glycosyltransferase [Candidatus Portnoybacteria bacterium]
MMYFQPFILAFLVGGCLTALAICLGGRFFKWPQRIRDVHCGNVPRLGGLALIAAFWLAVFFDKNLVIDKPLWGLLAASAVIFIFGLWDDLKNLRPFWQLAVQIFSGTIIIASGVAIDYVRSPFGGVIRLDQWQFALAGDHYNILGSLFIVIWIVLLINAVNWLDGLDGLAGGVSLIGFLTIFFLSVSPTINQPPIAILAMIMTGGLLGFLIFNFPRCGKSLIFLGTSGSMFVGFMLGSLSVYSGSKVATASLVLGVAILDTVFVVWQRLKSKNPIWQADRQHLHHRLLDCGFSKRQITLFYWALAVFFAFVAMISGAQAKLLAFFALCGIMILLILYVNARSSGKRLE